MEEFYLDLNNKTKSKLRVLFGLLFILLSIVNLYYYPDKQGMKIFHIMNIIMPIVLGCYFIIDGIGSKIKDFIGKRYIKINNDVLIIKMNYFRQEVKVKWDNLKSVDIKYPNLELFTKDNKKEEISIFNLDYKQIQNAKECLKLKMDKMNVAGC